MKISAQKLELLLAQKQMTAGELAKRSGLCRQNISTIRRRGTCMPITLAKLAKGLEVDPIDLIDKGED